ncbi:MAG TPA: BON domain-containing protein [Bryobacteraceae bacterium]|jgi:hyperosmotically inducible protein|nr:BON domain-containing protein [Bryobacteraceae bacterium]
MLRKNAIDYFAAVTGLLIAGVAVPAVSAQTQPDNTRVNKEDRSSAAVTADQQKNDHNDRYLTQQIRKAVMADKTLSTYAHNVKVISQNGNVTLKGPVQSEDERKTVLAKAEQIAGAGNVTDQLSIKTSQ